MLARRAVLWLLPAWAASGAAAWEKSEADLRAAAREIFRRVNQERSRHGLGALEWDERLAAEARRHSYNMVARWFFAHQDPLRGNLSKRLASSGILWHSCAENILNMRGYPDLASSAVEGWLRSPGHRENMLAPRFTRTGVGAVLRVDGTCFVTQDFIKP
ncbi:MAG TPA: CAP domain-containing protein [Bryobacteraceae bacterium]